MTIFSRLATLCLCCPALAHAALTLSTRVIYHEAQGEVTVPVQYAVDGGPILMQTWLDDGSDHVRPQDQNPPFLLTPSVARMQPGQTQTVRILKTRDDLPQDRESLFYLNVLEVPPVADDLREDQRNALQIAAHTTVKFFYRPKGLLVESGTAPQQLRFVLEGATTDDADGARVRVRVRVLNPSPYHVTLRDLKLHNGSTSEHAADPVMAQSDGPALAARDPNEFAAVIPPMSEHVITLPLATDARLPLPVAMRVHFRTINDYGRVYALQKPLEANG